MTTCPCVHPSTWSRFRVSVVASRSFQLVPRRDAFRFCHDLYVLEEQRSPVTSSRCGLCPCLAACGDASALLFRSGRAFFSASTEISTKRNCEPCFFFLSSSLSFFLFLSHIRTPYTLGRKSAENRCEEAIRLLSVIAHFERKMNLKERKTEIRVYPTYTAIV